MATLATLIVNLTANAEDFIGEMDKAESKVSKLTSGIGQNVQTLGTVALGGLGVVTGAVTGAGAALAKLAVDAAPIEGVKDAFAGLTETVEGGSAGMLAALEEGSAGMIAQSDLMMTFNKAAGLVSQDFAEQLPEAMQYLSKVAASTGQDMGFMLDSMVTGVGRLSPMILDNLNIQVSLADATAKAAEMFGVEESALTKTQQQAGMTAVVLEALAANTAAMPDVSESAAAGIARMQATFRNFKDEAGMAVLPVLNTLMDTFGNLVSVVLPPVVDFLETRLTPALTVGAEFVSTFVNSILAGQSPVEALQIALQSLGLDQIATQIGTVVSVVGELWATIQPYVAAAAEWIGQNVELTDVLTALGIAIASVVIPAIVSIITAAAPLIATAAALVAAVALVRTAWENDWLGIQEIVGVVTSFITDIVWPSIQNALDFLTTNVIPPLRDAIQDLWDKATTFWTNFWSAFQPGLEAMYNRLAEFWSDIQPKLMEAWNKLQELWDQVVDMWKTHLQPALDRLTEALGLGGDETGEFGEKVGALASLLLSVGLEGLLASISAAIDGFIFAVEAVTAAMDAWNSIIQAIKDALDALSSASMPEISFGASAMQEAELGAMSAVGASAIGFGGSGSPMVLAPVFLDSDRYTTAGGDIDYLAVAQRLRELQEGI